MDINFIYAFAAIFCKKKTNGNLDTSTFNDLTVYSIH